MRQTTADLNIINEHVAAVKKYNDIQKETGINLALQQMAQDLAGRPQQSLACAPAYAPDISWAHLPSDLRNLVMQVSQLSGWPPLAVLLIFLGCINASMRGRYQIRLNEHWSEAALLYLLVLAPSGRMKSFVYGLAASPLEDFEGRRMAEYNATLHRHAERAKAMRRAKDEARRSIIKEAKEEAGFDYRHLFELVSERGNELADAAKAYERSRPGVPRLLADSFTDKQLIRTMPERGGGHAIIQPEGETFVNRIKDSRFDIGILLKGYTMESYSHGTVTGGETYIRHPFLSILLTAQPHIAARLYGNQSFGALGLTPRFMPFFAPYLNAPATGSDDETTAMLKEYTHKITAALERNYTQDADRGLREISPSQEAYREVKKFQRDVLNRIAGGIPEHMEPFLRKLHGHAVRIAGVLHAWLHEEPEKHPIALREMEAGISIACAISAHAEFAFDPAGLCAYEDAQRILRWVRRHRHGVFDSRQAAQSSGVTTNLRIFPALDLLERHDILAQWVTPERPRQCVMHPYFNYNS